MKKKLTGFVLVLLFIISALHATGFKAFDGPYVEISSPSDNYETSQSTITVTGFSTGELPLNEYGYEIEYAGGGIFSEFWPISPPVEYFEFEISINIVEGEGGNLITVFTKDTQSNRGEDSVTVFLISSDDTEPPVVVITYPEDNQIFEDSEITVQGYIMDNVGIRSVDAFQYWDGEEYEIYSESFLEVPISFEFDFDVHLKPGSNKIIVNAYDEAKNKGEDIVDVTKDYECGHRTPTLTDNSGNTTFHGIFIGCNYSEANSSLMGGARNSAQTMFHNLRGRPGWNIAANTELLQDDDASYTNIYYAIERMKRRARPGDEFLFYFAGHGGNRTLSDDDGDEPDGFDECIQVHDGFIRDDTLAEWLSGFADCVTISVKLDCCASGGFADGDTDVQNAINAEGLQYGPDHINIEPACEHNETTPFNPHYWDDDGDNILEYGELRTTYQAVFRDANNNGRLDPGEEWRWWFDEDEDGVVDEGEIYDSDNTKLTWIGDFTYANLEGLEEDNSYKNDATTRADRNKDGITTTKELYEYSINYLYEKHNGDNDNDGLVDEDGPDFEETSSGIKILYIDNDGDGLIDEDPAPSSFAFWYDETPTKPGKPNGPVEGKPGEEYTYSSMSTDPENDDIFYWFDWGDGTNSEWIGPYNNGDDCDASHSWNEKGNYVIKVKSRDRCFAESNWTSLSVVMPKDKLIYRPFFYLFKNSPYLFPVLKHLQIYLKS